MWRAVPQVYFIMSMKISELKDSLQTDNFKKFKSAPSKHSLSVCQKWPTLYKMRIESAVFAVFLEIILSLYYCIFTGNTFNHFKLFQYVTSAYETRLDLVLVCLFCLLLHVFSKQQRKVPSKVIYCSLFFLK